MLLMALAALDSRSAEDLQIDLRSDEFQFFNVLTRKFRAGKPTDPIPSD